MDPKEAVRQAEQAYQSQDVDRIMKLFDPGIVMYWNGQKRGEGLAEVRAVHESMFAGDLQDFEIQKTLRAASGDTICVEWTTTWIDENGNHKGGFGGEFWTMRDDRLREWHAYHAEHTLDETTTEFLTHPSEVKAGED